MLSKYFNLYAFQGSSISYSEKQTKKNKETVKLTDKFATFILVHCSGVRLGRPPIGLLHQPRMMMMSVEQPVERLAGETGVFGENLSHWHFVHHKLQLEPSPPWRKASDYCKLCV
jgi:hypothetical protein